MNQILSSDALLGAAARPTPGRTAIAPAQAGADSGFGALIAPETETSSAAGGTAAALPLAVVAAPVAQARPALAFWSQLSAGETPHAAPHDATPMVPEVAEVAEVTIDTAAAETDVQTDVQTVAAETALMAAPVQQAMMPAAASLPLDRPSGMVGQDATAADPVVPTAQAAQSDGRAMSIALATPATAALAAPRQDVIGPRDMAPAEVSPDTRAAVSPQTSQPAPRPEEQAAPIVAASRGTVENGVPTNETGTVSPGTDARRIRASETAATAGDAVAADSRPRVKKEAAARQQDQNVPDQRPEGAAVPSATATATASAAAAIAMTAPVLTSGRVSAAPTTNTAAAAVQTVAASQPSFRQPRADADAVASVSAQSAAPVHQVSGRASPTAAVPVATGPASTAFDTKMAPEATEAGAVSAAISSPDATTAVGADAARAAGMSDAPASGIAPQAAEAGNDGPVVAASAAVDPAAIDPAADAAAQPVAEGAVRTTAPDLTAAAATRAGGALRVAAGDPAETGVKAAVEHGAKRRAKDVVADDAALTQSRLREARGTDNAAASPATTQAENASGTAKDSVVPGSAAPAVPAADTGRGPEGLRFDALGGVSGTTGGSERSAATAGLTQSAAMPQHGAATAQGVAVQIASALSSLPDKPVELALSPEELGKVRLTLSHGHDGGISVAVQAERPETLDLMRRHIDQLASDFRDMGYSSIDFSFSGGQNFSGQQHPEAAPEGFATSGERSSDAAAATPVMAAAADPIRLRLADDSGLDMRL